MAFGFLVNLDCNVESRHSEELKHCTIVHDFLRPEDAWDDSSTTTSSTGSTTTEWLLLVWMNTHESIG